MLIVGEILRAAIALFVIMNPFSSMPVFLSLTARLPPERVNQCAMRAATVAGATLVGFTLIGPALLEIVKVSMASFQVGGGILLLAIALKGILWADGKNREEEDIDVGLVLIAVPLLTGPGAMTTAILLSSAVGMETVLVATAIATVAVLLALRFTKNISKLLRPSGVQIVSKIANLLLAALAVEFIRRGLSVTIGG